MQKTPTNEQRSVLITGCSSGIGLCLAEGLRTRGYRVLATARRTADIERLRRQGFEAIELDLNDSTSVRAAAEDALERSQGQLFALINNAGYGQPGAVEDLTRAALRAQFETNVFGTQELTNLIIPAMRANSVGRIVYISSLLGIVCLPYRGAYSASKFAVEALADTLRLELHGTDIGVSLVEPGPIDTRFRANSNTAYQQQIDRDTSAHRENYAHVEMRLGDAKPLSYALPPDAVLKQVVRALEKRYPAARYTVTAPAALFSLLRRLLPAAALDIVARRIGGGGRR